MPVQCFLHRSQHVCCCRHRARLRQLGRKPKRQGLREMPLSGLRQYPCVSEAASPTECKRGVASRASPAANRPDPIPSLAWHHFSLALSQGCHPCRALAPGAALTCHRRACACAVGGAWKRLCAIFAWLELDPASCTGAIGVFQCVQHSLRHPSAAGVGQGRAHWRW